MPEYLDVDGHQVYSYEWDNNGEAVVLLHGGLSQTSHWDSYILPAVEDDFHVFAYDRTGHGFTGDQLKSFHYQHQTDEAISYLKQVVKEPAHLIGYSDGGIIALMVAMQQPARSAHRPSSRDRPKRRPSNTFVREWGFCNRRGRHSPWRGDVNRSWQNR